MKAPLKWLRDYVDIDMNLDEFSDAMTMSGTKVEGYEMIGEDIRNIVIGRIIKIVPHPNADKLIITNVDISDKIIQIVTGAKNVKEGDIVPVAVDGSSLPGGIEIKTGELRGELSEGMLCSAKELGIDEKYVDEKSKDGIYILGEDFEIGSDAKKALLMEDAVVEFELTSNRPDCQSMIGLAHEAAATFDSSVRLPDRSFDHSSEEISFSIEVQNDELCPRYALREIKDVKITSSPYFIQRRLIESGIRPINNIVDITNYVMLEYGQPLHAFDADKIMSKKIVVKQAVDEQKFTTLDDVERTLDSSMLMITDGTDNLAIAGVMGGQNSEIDDDTTRIVLESANFSADNIRLTSKKLGLRTEASSRFEKGIDLYRVEEALDRACHLIDHYGFGKVLDKKADSFTGHISPKEISVSLDRINNLIGEEFEPEQICRLLSRLQFGCEIEGRLLNIKVPVHRLDINMDADIAEEVARLYGYNNITSKNIYGELTLGTKSEERIAEDIIKDAMMSNGITEILTYSFVSPSGMDKIHVSSEDAVKIINPLGEETSALRTSLVPEMLEVVERNISRKVDFFSGFEIGNIFENKIVPVQERSIVAASYGKDEDFFSMKSRLEGVLDFISVDDRDYIASNENKLFHPMRCAKITASKQDIGFIGEIHPMILEEFDIKKRVYLFELDFKVLMQLRQKTPLYKAVAKYPSIKRDIALVVDKKIYVRDIENVIIENADSLVKNIELFDIYTGDQLPEDKKSVAYSITYTSDERTLTDEDVSKVQNRILQKLDEKLGASLRQL